MKLIITFLITFTTYIVLVNIYKRVVDVKYTYLLKEGLTTFYKHFKIGCLKFSVASYKTRNLIDAKEYKNYIQLKYGKKIYSRKE